MARAPGALGVKQGLIVGVVGADGRPDDSADDAILPIAGKAW
jgi:hypothetical protein